MFSTENIHFHFFLISGNIRIQNIKFNRIARDKRGQRQWKKPAYTARCGRSIGSSIATAPMAPKGGRGKGGKNGKRMDDADMVKLLVDRIAAETPRPGTNPLADKMSADAPPLAKRFDQVCVRVPVATCHLPCLCHLIIAHAHPFFALTFWRSWRFRSARCKASKRETTRA